MATLPLGTYTQATQNIPASPGVALGRFFGVGSLAPLQPALYCSTVQPAHRLRRTARSLPAKGGLLRVEKTPSLFFKCSRKDCESFLLPACLPSATPSAPGARKRRLGAPKGPPGARKRRLGAPKGRPGAPKGRPGAPKGRPGAPKGPSWGSKGPSFLKKFANCFCCLNFFEK